jgi:membrane protease YdiL (CAAX protease family)
MAMGAVFQAMRESRVFDDLTARDRDPRAVALTVPVGLLAAVVAGLLGAVSASLAVMVVVSGLDGALAATALFEVFDRPDLAASDGLYSLFVLAVLAGVNGAAAVAFVAVAGGLTHRKVRDYLVEGGAFRKRQTLLGLLAVGAAMSLVVLAVWLLGLAPATPPVLSLEATTVARASYAAFAVVLLLIAAAAEEIVFRGWLLKQTGAFIRHPVALMAINGLVFALIHFDPNLDAFLVRAAMGAGLTWMTLRTGGIELAIGAHAANNIVILLLLRPLSIEPDTQHAFQATALISAVAIPVGYAALAETVVRWPGVLRWIGGREGATA